MMHGTTSLKFKIHNFFILPKILQSPEFCRLGPLHYFAPSDAIGDKPPDIPYILESNPHVFADFLNEKKKS